MPFSVIFFPDNLASQVEPGTNLLKAATLAGIQIKSGCGGRGTCGRCAVLVKQGNVKVLDTGNLPPKMVRAGYVLACRTIVEGNVVVEVPKDSRLEEHQVLVDAREILMDTRPEGAEGYELDPMARRARLELPRPTIAENASDLSRLLTELGNVCLGSRCDVKVSLSKLRTLPSVLRAKDWKVTVTLSDYDGLTEITDVVPGLRHEPVLGLAVDIGTTTVVAHLVDLETGKTLDKRGTYNKQAAYGDDVISRIVHATEEPNGLKDLQTTVIDTINELIDKLVARNKVNRNDIVAVITAGNTTMSHLFLSIDPRYLRLEPYIPPATTFPSVKAGELGLKVNPEAWVFVFPCVASYVGGDIVSGVLSSGLSKAEDVQMLIDIGTNGEMVLGNKDWMVACSCSAGPAFEGGGITFGMRAMKGAIERVFIDPPDYEVSLRTIRGGKPIGICGSGLIDCLSKMRESGIIDRSGKIREDLPHPRLRAGDDGREFVLAWGEETECQKDVYITESDIKNLLRAKAAVFAGVRTLLKTVGMDMEDISRVMIAGGFGNYLNVKDAIRIGLLPDIPVSKYEFIGNSSVKGAVMALKNRKTLEEACAIAKGMTYIELSADNAFMEEFVSGLFLPHTDLGLFPSLATEIRR